MGKHIKPPFTLRHVPTDTRDGPDDYEIYDAEGNLFCVVNNAEAAALVVAAPELLDALVVVQKRLPDGDYTLDELQQMRRAIAKAKGEVS